MGSAPPEDDTTGPGDSRRGEQRPHSGADDPVRAQARALRPWAWAVLLALLLAVVFVCNIFLFGAASNIARIIQAPGTSTFWQVIFIVLVWGLWIAVGIALLTAFRRWFRQSLGPVWRRALRRIPRAVAAIMGTAVGVMTLVMGIAWHTDAALLLFVSLTWAIIVAVSVRPPRL